ncbi:MAG: pyridoxamine 5'-phosphate oxidase [Bacteroidales bacterium]|nr:pyridoxamine 5'-phosphate oxidase [Bacteroidales bacterium]
MNIAGIRKDYIKHSLDAVAVGSNPVAFFSMWLDEAVNAGALEPTAMAVSSVSEHGRPSSRMVLLKGIDDGKFTFFTNYSSRKGKEMTANSEIALLFFWPELERQVRVEGTAARVSDEESDAYFNSRPLESRIGAVASPQSDVITGRKTLEELYNSIAEKTISEGIVRPDNWGGFAVIPHTFEFWQGRPGRLHDRIRFRSDGNEWIKERLAP